MLYTQYKFISNAAKVLTYIVRAYSVISDHYKFFPVLHISVASAPESIEFRVIVFLVLRGTLEPQVKDSPNKRHPLNEGQFPKSQMLTVLSPLKKC